MLINKAIDRFASLAEAWADYRAKVLPADAPPVQVDECRTAFYAGAGVTYQMLMAAADGDEAAMPERLSSLDREIHEFIRSGPHAIVTPSGSPIAPDYSFEVRDTEIEVLLRDIGTRIGTRLPANLMFALFLFSSGPGGNCFYISSAERAGVAEMLDTWRKRQVS